MALVDTETGEIVVTCTPTEARALTEQIRETTDALWSLLSQAHERGVHRALGYDSFKAYVAAEFGMESSHAYRLLDMAAVVRALTTDDGQSPIGDSLPESHARELAPLKDDPAKVREAYTLAKDTAADEGVKLTAKTVREAVTEVIERNNEGLANVNRRTLPRRRAHGEIAAKGVMQLAHMAEELGRLDASEIEPGEAPDLIESLARSIGTLRGFLNQLRKVHDNG